MKIKIFFAAVLIGLFSLAGNAHAASGGSYVAEPAPASVLVRSNAIKRVGACYLKLSSSIADIQSAFHDKKINYAQKTILLKRSESVRGRLDKASSLVAIESPNVAQIDMAKAYIEETEAIQQSVYKALSDPSLLAFNEGAAQ